MATEVLNDKSDNDRKIFCGGLSKYATEEDLREYFSNYGTVESVNLKKDIHTNHPRGFGFVVFEDASSVAAALATEKHELKGKEFGTKPAEGPPPMLKVFAGGLKPETTDEDIRAHFEVYGNITHINIAVDKVTRKSRGFAFITYETEAMADAASAEKKQEIIGKMADVKKAEPENSSGGGRGGGRGGRGGGRGMGGYNGGGYGGGGGGYGGPRGYNGYNDGYNGYGGYDNYNSYDDYDMYAADSYGPGYGFGGGRGGGGRGGGGGGYNNGPPQGGRRRYQPY